MKNYEMNFQYVIIRCHNVLNLSQTHVSLQNLFL